MKQKEQQVEMVQAPELRLCDVVQAYAPQSGGVKRYLHDKMRFYAQFKNIQHLLIVPGAKDEEQALFKSRVVSVASPRIPFSKGYRLPVRMDKIRDIIWEYGPDVVEVDSPLLHAWAAADAADEQGVASVAFYHSDFPRALGSKLDGMSKLERLRPFDRVLSPLFQAYLRSLFGKMHAVITATNDFRELLQSFGVKNVVESPLGTDTQVFRPINGAREQVFQELGLAEDTMLLLYVGRFAGMKNLPQLLEMMELVQHETRKLHLLCIGEGELAELVDEAAGARGDVTRKGYVAEKSALARYYSAADLFVHAGTLETFGLVAVEAQACGTRVLGVQGGGMDLTLQGEDPLIMAASEEPEDLAEALRAIMELNEGEDAAKARRERMRSRFSQETSLCRLLALYDHLRKGNPAAQFSGRDVCANLLQDA